MYDKEGDNFFHNKYNKTKYARENPMVFHHTFIKEKFVKTIYEYSMTQIIMSISFDLVVENDPNFNIQIHT